MKRGEILLTLAYNPVTGILDATIVKCRDLKPMDISGYSGLKNLCRKSKISTDLLVN